MAGIGKQGGQRGNTNSSSGRKARSPTSTSHKGSRVEPSHLTEKDRDSRAKKAAKSRSTGKKG